MKLSATLYGGNASASPRNSDSVPSVTIKGGKRSRVMSSAFRPPAPAPITSVSAAATATGRPASRQIIPNTTADKPISEPTDRSMPPETITGVSASANRPISTLKRRTSKALAREAKFLPRTQKTATSATSSNARIASWVNAARGRARASGAGELLVEVERDWRVDVLFAQFRLRMGRR